MDAGLCLSEEHRGSGRNSQRPVPSVRAYTPDDFEQFCKVLYLYGQEVLGEDTSQPYEVRLGGQAPFTCPKVEAIAMGYLITNHEVLLAMSGETVVGFMVYRCSYDCLLLVRSLYVLPEYQGLGLVKSFKLASFRDRQIHRVFYQTRSDRPPEVLLQHTEKRSRLIQKKGNLLTWEMTWGG